MRLVTILHVSFRCFLQNRVIILPTLGVLYTFLIIGKILAIVLSGKKYAALNEKSLLSELILSLVPTAYFITTIGILSHPLECLENLKVIKMKILVYKRAEKTTMKHLGFNQLYTNSKVKKLTTLLLLYEHPKM